MRSTNGHVGRQNGHDHAVGVHDGVIANGINTLPPSLATQPRSKQKNCRASRLQPSLENVKQRGPDATVRLAHCRLSINDPTWERVQPPPQSMTASSTPLSTEGFYDFDRLRPRL